MEPLVAIQDINSFGAPKGSYNAVFVFPNKLVFRRAPLFSQMYTVVNYSQVKQVLTDDTLAVDIVLYSGQELSVGSPKKELALEAQKIIEGKKKGLSPNKDKVSESKQKPEGLNFTDILSSKPYRSRMNIRMVIGLIIGFIVTIRFLLLILTGH